MNRNALASVDLTEMLKAWSEGDRQAENELFTIVYDELHRQAHRHLRRERANHSLQTSALINEAYLKLVEQRNVEWQNRAHFFGLAGEMMRRILVDYAKTKNRLKRGGEAAKVPLEEALLIPVEEREIDLLALDEALDRLNELDEQQARVVELRYFSGLSIEETAEVLKISPATVKRNWNMAKAWLNRELSRNSRE